MKFFALFALLVITAYCASVDPLDGLSEEQAFHRFIKTYKRVYGTEEDFDHRFGVFQNNLKIIGDLNAKDPTAIFGINEFTDLSPEEFADRYLMKNFSEFKEDLEKNGPLDLLPSAKALSDNTTSLPASYDWNSKGCVTSIYQQGSCGSCWAFGATENLESVACIAKKAGLRQFSMQQVLDCSSGGCQGGYPSSALTYVTQSGIMAYNAYPYTGSKGRCRFAAGSVVQKFSGWGYVDKSRNEPKIQNWVSTTGAPAVCVQAKTWQYYQGGVLSSNCANSIDHVVQVTGWTTMSGKLAWKVRNSWGTGWGSSGYMYIEIGKNLCGLAQEVLSGN